MIFCSSLVALLLAGRAPAAGAAPSYREALLFSLSDRTSLDGYEVAPQRFLTRLVGLSENGNHYTSEYAALVMPIESGFANLAVERTCEMDGASDAKDSQSCKESIRVTPISSLSEARDGVQAGYTPPCGYDYTTILFASPRFVATYRRSGATEPCNWRGWNYQEHWEVRNIPNDGTGLVRKAAGFSDVFGEPGRIAYAAAAKAALNHTIAIEGPSPLDEMCAVDPTTDTGWTLRRVRTAWVARLVQQDGPGSCQPEADLALAADARLIGYDEVPLAWEAVTKAVPDATEAFASPFGGLVLVASPSRVDVFDRRAATWRLLGSWPRGPIVTVQWSKGTGADRWVDAFRGRNP